ncbi:MAG: ABC transporter substrate-binding protein [Solirubrobacterales bacterium]
MLRRIRLRGLAAAALAASLTALCGCGGGDTSSSSVAPSGRPAAGGGGQLTYALPAIPASLDPLAASSREAQLITLQEHEPLVAQFSGPYGDRSAQPGLALAIRPSKDRTVWTLQLRDRVRFHDGTPFNAAAVLANARRWRSLPAGPALIPTLFAVDAPRPDVVRFLLRSPTPDLPNLLSSPRLGIVSPQALRPHNGERARIAGNLGGPGTGPFQLSQISEGRIGLARYPSWWGSPLGLGPALDGVEFRAVPSEPERLALLQGGESQIAEGFAPKTLSTIRHDPLLTALPGPAGIGMQRSVRGLVSAAPVSFSGVWLTTVEGAAP